jgi:hypothetical protein
MAREMLEELDMLREGEYSEASLDSVQYASREVSVPCNIGEDILAAPPPLGVRVASDARRHKLGDTFVEELLYHIGDTSLPRPTRKERTLYDRIALSLSLVA